MIENFMALVFLSSRQFPESSIKSDIAIELRQQLQNVSRRNFILVFRVVGGMLAANGKSLQDFITIVGENRIMRYQSRQNKKRRRSRRADEICPGTTRERRFIEFSPSCVPLPFPCPEFSEDNARKLLHSISRVLCFHSPCAREISREIKFIFLILPFFCVCTRRYFTVFRECSFVVAIKLNCVSMKIPGNQLLTPFCCGINLDSRFQGLGLTEEIGLGDESM